MSEISRCPFCGGEASVHRCEHAFHDAKIRCAGCQAEGPIFDVDDGEANEAGRNEAEAIAAWNRRTPAPEGEAMPGSAYDGGHMGSDGDWHGPEGEVVGNPVLWKDRPDEWTDAILAAHPVNSTDPERHNRFALAMKMVGNRHGKYELVGLVHWLLTRLDAASPVVPVGVSREEIAEILKDEVLTDGGIIMSSEPSSTRRLRIAARILAALRPTDTGRE